MLHVHRSERADGLLEALAELLGPPPSDPFAREVVAVPTRGMERWLSQRLSASLGARPGRSDGVCAGIEFAAPGPLLASAVAEASGVDPASDPWRPERLVWPLLEIVEAELGEPWLADLQTHLLRTRPQESPPAARRLGVVRHLAELFSRYALHRPDMLLAWAAGSDAGGDRRAVAWQAELWRRLRARLDVPSPAERLERACERLEAQADSAGLPDRLSLFGLTRLPAGHLQVLGALARGGREVHLLLLHPSGVLWESVSQRLQAGAIPLSRAEDPTREVVRNRILGSWGRDAREMQVVLAREAFADHHRPVSGHEGPATLLTRLQADVRADRQPPGPPPPGHEAGSATDRRGVLDPRDRSVQVHGCYGRSRQVEVLRDAILHMLRADPTLEPRDVIVMCPDIESFAPLIRATFAAGAPTADGVADADADDDRGLPELRIRLADRSLRQVNPLLDAVSELLELSASRSTASAVLGFADRDPVRRRFRLDDDDVGRLGAWTGACGIRWGLDEAHRAPWGLAAIPAGTWRSGLDRVLLGVTMSEEEHRLFGGVLPFDDVGGDDIGLAGRFAELVERLATAVDGLSGPKSIPAWTAALAHAADALFATSRRDAWQRAELDRILDGLAAEAGREAPGARLGQPQDPGPELTAAELRSLLAERLRGRPTRANFRTGSLTFCTLHPMRSVPHRVVCLLGIDDDTFPRRAARDGDDLTLIDPRLGERDGRAEDRQMLLDALLAAGQHLLITYSAADERTGARRPPAVPVGELLDAVDATVRPEARGTGVQSTGPLRASAAITTLHPLQPFDPRSFTAGALAPGTSWSFDRLMADGARALTAPRRKAPPFLDGRLPPRRSPVVALEDLIRFVRRPVASFLRLRLGISPGGWDDEVRDGLPVELGTRERWGVGDRLLEARRRGADGREACLAEIRRGLLPPGQLGKPVVDEVYRTVERILALAHETVGEDLVGVSHDVRVELPDGRSLRGTVPGVCAGRVHSVTYSKLKADDRIRAWVRFLALTATEPASTVEALTIGRAPSGSRLAIARIGPLADSPAESARIARAELIALIDLFDRGMREPLPLPCRTGEALVRSLLTGEDDTDARTAWEGTYGVPGERGAAEHALALGRPGFDELIAIAPGSDESGPAGAGGGDGRLVWLARRLWEPLLAREEIVRR